MTYDASRHALVLFGGVGETPCNGGLNPLFTFVQDTWEWDGAWVLRSNAGPTPRFLHAMAYDTHRRRVVLFGGRGPNVADYFNDLWEWDGNSWTQIAVSGTIPAARFVHGFVYDEHRHLFVLHGGSNANGVMSDTWELHFNAPVIPDGPADQAVSAGQPVAFAATVQGIGPFQFQWRRNGLPLTDDGRITGATTTALSITATVPQDAGNYELMVTNSCYTVTSDPATLTVNSSHLSGDMNCDNIVNVADVPLFIEALIEPASFTGCDITLADMNSDGSEDGQDVHAFAAAVTSP